MRPKSQLPSANPAINVVSSVLTAQMVFPKTKTNFFSQTTCNVKEIRPENKNSARMILF